MVGNISLELAIILIKYMDEQNQNIRNRGIGGRPEIFYIPVIETATGKLKEVRKIDTINNKETIVKKSAKMYKEYEAKFKV
jgi:hypothetical protein